GEIDHSPRFGVHFSQPAPPAADCTELNIGGPAVTQAFALPHAELALAPRRSLTADFHCVAGWTFRGLRWEGVHFRAFYESTIVPRAHPREGVSHLRFTGADGYASVLTLEDALGEDVLLADRLDGEPLSTDHGAPLRLLSPAQYGYKSTKHLVSIELFTSEPAGSHRNRLRRFLLALVRPHERARVAHEERRRHVPAWLLRPI